LNAIERLQAKAPAEGGALTPTSSFWAKRAAEQWGDGEIDRLADGLTGSNGDTDDRTLRVSVVSPEKVH
jgi:hypothetical protein